MFSMRTRERLRVRVTYKTRLGYRDHDDYQSPLRARIEQGDRPGCGTFVGCLRPFFSLLDSIPPEPLHAIDPFLLGDVRECVSLGVEGSHVVTAFSESLAHGTAGDVGIEQEPHLPRTLVEGCTLSVRGRGRYHGRRDPMPLLRRTGVLFERLDYLARVRLDLACSALPQEESAPN